MILDLILLNSSSSIQIESLISDLAFILILAAFTTLLFKWMKQPVVLGYIVAGFLASPHFEYLPSVTTESNIDFWAQIGIIVLLFSLGIEFSFKKLMNAGGSAVVTALIIIVGMMTVGLGLGHLMGFSHINSIFLGGMMSMSSTTIIIKALTDLNLRHKKFASQVLAVLIVEDLFAVLMMVVLSSIAINNTVEGGELLFSISKLAFFLIMWFLVGVYILPSLLNGVRGYLNNETLLIVSMGLCLGMAIFSVICGFSLALGAFVMGSILAGTSFAERIDKVITPIKDLFGAVFFISVGMMVNPDVIVQYWSPILIISATVIVGMIIFGTFGMLVTGQSLLVSMEAGFSLTQIGEFSFIIATLGMSLGVLDASIYPVVVAVSVITTFLTPYFIRLAHPAYNFVNRMLPEKARLFLERYSEKSTSNETANNKLWVRLFKRSLSRVLIYTVILTAITLVSLNIFYPEMMRLIPDYGKLVTVAVTITAMSPFLFALTNSSIKKSEKEALMKESASHYIPLSVMMVFRFIIAWCFLVYFLFKMYSFVIALIVGLAVFLILFLLFSKRFKKRFTDIESKFYNNLNERELRRSGKNNNLINNMHLAYVEVGYGCPFVGERLADSEIRKNYGVNVVNIQRGNKFIVAPRGDMRVFPGDILGVVGTDDEIQKLLPHVEAPEQSSPDDKQLNPTDIKLTNIQLSGTSQLIGKTMASSGLRNIYSALVVGVEREGEFIELNGSLEFKEKDIIWLVGDHKVLSKLA